MGVDGIRQLKNADVAKQNEFIKDNKNIDVDKPLFNFFTSNNDKKVSKEFSISDFWGSNNSKGIEKQTMEYSFGDELVLSTKNSEGTNDIDGTQEINGEEAQTKQTTQEEDKDIANMTAEEIQNMSTEELIELFRGDLGEAFWNAVSGESNGDKNFIDQNSILCDLVGKMTDEQLDDFMKKYKEMYPKALDNGVADLFSFESLAKGAMWGNYAVAAGKIPEDKLNSAMERLKEYFKNLIPNESVYEGTTGFVQWL